MGTQKNLKKLLVLGTGGTIAGKAEDRADNVGYRPAQLDIGQLLNALPGLDARLGAHAMHCEQVAQVDSKDMSFAIWRELALRLSTQLSRADVSGAVITHGTDTLEETAYFLHRVLPHVVLRKKPVVLTCAMRPASSENPDGPQNLLDAVTVALDRQASGVLVVCAGVVHGALDVQKVHTYRLDAFSSGDAGPIAFVEEAALRVLRAWPVADSEQTPSRLQGLLAQAQWPRVDIVMNYAGVGGEPVLSMLRDRAAKSRLKGLVVAGTGNGTVHEDLSRALEKAQLAGVRVVRTSRCANGRVLASGRNEFSAATGLSAPKARIELMLKLFESASLA